MNDQDTYEKAMCRVCGYSTPHLSSHLRSIHGLRSPEYKAQYPGAPIVCKQRSEQFANNNPNKTENFRKRMKETMSKENNPNYGTQHTEEWKKNMSERMMGENHPMYGRHQSEEVKKNMSIRNKGEGNPMYGKAGFGGMHHTEETKQKMAESRSEFMSKFYTKRTTIEEWCTNQLLIQKVKFSEQQRVGKFLYDFEVMTSEGIKYIEVNGDFWHSNPNIYDLRNLTTTQITNICRDKLKLEKVGRENLLILWEQDIKKRPYMCIFLIKAFILGDTRVLHSYDFKRRSIHVD